MPSKSKIFTILFALTVLYLLYKFDFHNKLISFFEKNIPRTNKKSDMTIPSHVSTPQMHSVDDNTPYNKSSAPYKLLYFYSPNCGACVNFENTWNQIAQNQDKLILSKHKINVNSPENSYVVFYYHIKHTPTLILIKSDGNSVEYDGTNNLQDVTEFIYSNL